MKREAFVRKVANYIRAEGMLRGGEHIIAGISGGADSMCLLFVLLELKDEFDLDITAVHVNHCLRGSDADGDMEFTEDMCFEYGVPCVTYLADVKELSKQSGLGEEETGRIARYNIFRQVYNDEDADILATAHHMDDNAETVIMNAVRGCGLSGLRGIEPRSGVIIRPLLCVTKAEILEFMDAGGLQYRTDATNSDRAYMRNRIRLEVIPYMEENLNRQAVRHLAGTAEYAGDACDFMEKTALSRMKRAEDGPRLRAEYLKKQHRAVAKEIIRIKIQKSCGHLKDIGAAHINAVYGLLTKQTGSRADLPYGLKVVKDHDALNFITGEEDREGPLITLETAPYTGEAVPEGSSEKWFDSGRIINDPVLRTPRPGDYMTIKGGHKKKFNRVLIDDKIPSEYRDRITVLADGDHIMWCESGRISEYYKVSEDTDNILILKIEEEEK